MFRVLISLVAIVTFSGVALAQQDLLKQVQTISLNGVEGRFDHFGIDLEGKRLFVAALGNNTVEVIDLTAGKRLQSISGLKKPTGIRVLPGSRKIVVASGEDGKVRVYDPSLELIGTLNDLEDADNVRLSPDAKLAYVGYGDGAIAVIDPEQPKQIGTIKLEGHPEAFQLKSDGNRLFVNVPSAKQVAVIDCDKRAVIAKWPIREAEANFPMALDEANHRLFIGCRRPAKVLVLNTDTGKTAASVDCCGDTDDLFYDPPTRRLYVSGGEGCISVVQCEDGDHYRLLGNSPTAAGARTSLYVPELGSLYVAVPHRGAQQPELRVYHPVK